MPKIRIAALDEAATVEIKGEVTMKTGSIIGALALLAAATASSAAASCKDELAALEPQSHADSRAAIAHTSGGQAVAAEREAKSDAATPAPSGGPADRAMQTKVGLDEARAALKKGDEAGCMAALEKAKSGSGK
jgi:hypothetical protein